MLLAGVVRGRFLMQRQARYSSIPAFQHSSIWHYVDHFRPTTLGSLSVATLTYRVKVGKLATLKDPGVRGRSPML